MRSVLEGVAVLLFLMALFVICTVLLGLWIGVVIRIALAVL
jgi:hypothetical protein